MERMIDRSPIGLVSILMGIAVVDGADGLTRFLAVGDPLHAGDTVRVPGQGEIEIRFNDDTRASVGGGDSLYLDPARWQAADMPLDPEREEVLDIHDVLPDTQHGADLRAYLTPVGADGNPDTAAEPADFPLNQQDPDLPGWYLGAGALFTAEQTFDDPVDGDPTIL